MKLLLFATITLITALTAHAFMTMSGTPLSPPAMIVLPPDTRLQLPGGEEILLPDGATVPACGDPNSHVLLWDPTARALFMLEPCTGIFQSGFE